MYYPTNEDLQRMDSFVEEMSYYFKRRLVNMIALWFEMSSTSNRIPVMKNPLVWLSIKTGTVTSIPLTLVIVLWAVTMSIHRSKSPKIKLFK